MTKPRPTDLERLASRADTNLGLHRRRQEQQVNDANQILDALAAASPRQVVAHALRHGVSARPASGQPTQTAVGEGALLIAQVLHREGVTTAEVESLLELWRTPIDATELLVAAEQLLGPDFCRLTYARGTPLADLCEVLLGSVHEPGDLIAAGRIVASIHRKLGLITRPTVTETAPRPRKPFVRKYTTRAGGATPS